VWLEEYEALIILHLALGTVLWMVVTWTVMSLYRSPQPDEPSAPVPADRAMVTA
jgi:hypothetical protein